MQYDESLAALNANPDAEDVPASQAWQASLYLAHAAAMTYAKDRERNYNFRSYQVGEVGYPQLELAFVKTYPVVGNAPQMVAGYRGDSAVVGFRGTATLADWYTDLRAGRDEFGLAGVHGGFLRVYEALRPDLMAFVRSARTVNRRRLWLAGHSLGGALAVLAGLALSGQQDIYTPDGVLTVGAPRVGDANFKLMYGLHPIARRTFQFVNAGDIVPTVPRSADGYAHVGRRFKLEEGQGPVELDDDEDAAFSRDYARDTLLPFVRQGVGGGDDSAHSTRLYLSNIAALPAMPPA